jgi:hypothetical protein
MSSTSPYGLCIAELIGPRMRARGIRCECPACGGINELADMEPQTARLEKSFSRKAPAFRPVAADAKCAAANDRN